MFTQSPPEGENVLQSVIAFTAFLPFPSFRNHLLLTGARRSCSPMMLSQGNMLCLRYHQLIILGAHSWEELAFSASIAELLET